ncbi:hypothetical protein EDC94DRAFT_594007 [Helicostylum pulchrum]|nr:hypothetical protein EDC94DRAFT_594007 [Helicostylum pulchrum]
MYIKAINLPLLPRIQIFFFRSYRWRKKNMGGVLDFGVCPAGIVILPEKIISIRTVCVSVENGDIECYRDFGDSTNCTDYHSPQPKGSLQQDCYSECMSRPNSADPNTSDRNTTSTEVTYISAEMAGNLPASAAATVYPTFIITFAALLFVLLLSSKRSY